MHIHSLTKHSVDYGENRSIAPPILSIGKRWTWVVCYTSRRLYPRGKNSRNTGLDCGWPPNRTGVVARWKMHGPCGKPHPVRQARSLFIRLSYSGSWTFVNSRILNYVLKATLTICLYLILFSRLCPHRVFFGWLNQGRWGGWVAPVVEKINVCMILVGKPEGKRALGRPSCRWENNIKMGLKGIG